MRTDAAIFMLIKDSKVLVEKRREDKEQDPGQTTLPGGGVEGGESVQDALVREAKEELGIDIVESQYVCTLQLRRTNRIRQHYYAITGWTGELSCNEAAALSWIGLDEKGKLDHEADRVALTEYERTVRE